MKRFWVVLLVLVLAVPAGRAGATSFVRMSDEALVNQAPLVIEGRVGDKLVHDQDGRPVTDFPVEVLDVLKGPDPGGRVTLRVAGGIRPDGSGLYLYGAPKFAPGEEALLFLAPAADGSYRPVQWALGVFHRGRDGQGHPLALRDLSEVQEIQVPGRANMAQGLRNYDQFKSWLRQRGQGQHPQPDYRSAPAPDTVQNISAPYTFFTQSGYRMRWFAFDEGGSVTWLAQSTGLPAMPGNGFAEFQAGLAAWTNDAGSNVQYSYGGTTTANGGFATSDGVNAILFNDPNNEIPGSYDCYNGGTLAIGGPWFSGMATFNGSSYYIIQEGDIVVQDGAGCFLSLHSGQDGAEVFAHELGHTLGLDHSTVSDALMYYQAHGDGRGPVLAADDQAGIATLYPAGAPPTSVEAPASITVPANSSTGTFAVSWAASATAGASYELQEATNASFSSGLRTAYSGSGTSTTISGKGNGTYYYRVKAVKSGMTDSAWTTAGNGCTVSLAAVAAPAAITVPATSSTGTFAVSWTSSATAGASYELQEATNASFSSGLRIAYSGSGTSATISGKGNGTYYYRVKAVKSGLPDSAWTTAGNGCAVSLAAVAAPATIAVPASNSTGSFIVSWSASATAGASYVLQEATSASFSSGLRTAYSGSGTSAAISGKSSGTYYYRVKAVKSGLPDSAWTTAGNGCTVTIPPPPVSQVAPPASLSVPAQSDSGTYLVSWGASPTPGAAYELQEATNSLFSAGLRTAYTGSGTSVTVTGRTDGTYYYRVRGTKLGYNDSDWQGTGNGCVVTLAPPPVETVAAPAALTVPATSSSGAYSVSWSPSATAGANYVLEEAGNATFTAGLREAYRGTATSAAISGRLNGSYYYRVKALKSGLEDSPWTMGSNACTVSLPVVQNGLRFASDDSGLQGLRRSDGGSDDDNLVSGQRPRWDLAFEFRVILQDASGAPPARVRLYLDGYGYDLSLVSGTLAQGALFSRSMQLGPAAAHSFHFEAQDGAGNLVYRLPASGELPGPQIALLNGYSQVGVPGAVNSTSLDPSGLGGEKVYRWDSAGLDDGTGNGAYQAASGSPVQAGEGLFLKAGSGPVSLPALSQVGTNSAVETVIPLHPGWNLVSNPYRGEVALGDVRVSRAGGSTLGWTQAAASQWVVNALYGFKGSDWGSLYEFSSAGGTPEAVLVPWRAYWLYLARDDGSYSLRIARPTLQGVFLPND